MLQRAQDPTLYLSLEHLAYFNSLLKNAPTFCNHSRLRAANRSHLFDYPVALFDLCNFFGGVPILLALVILVLAAGANPTPSRT